MADGKLAVVMVMPHGILFRGGEERACRQQFIKDGILEAVIGLPTNLCYSTGIPACVLVINTNCAATRRDVLFINADREFREGKNLNALRAEDIEKIAQVYRTRQNLDKYSRVVSVEELERKDFNLSIRRDIDNSPPPEPHDVRAHLHGSIPVAEIDALSDYFKNYEGVKDAIFAEWASLPVPHEMNGQECPFYCNFTPTITTKDQINITIESASGLQTKYAAFQKAITGWWKKNLAEIERLPETKNVFELRRRCIDSLAKTRTSQDILTGH